MRLGRIRFFARKALIKTSQHLKYLHFYSKTWAKNHHPAGREFETPGVDKRPSRPAMSLKGDQSQNKWRAFQNWTSKND